MKCLNRVSLMFVVFSVLLVWSSPVVVNAQADAHVGNWKLNAAKSKQAPGNNATIQTRTYALYGDGLKVTIETVNRDGSKITGGYSAHFDGRDYPLTGNNIADMIALNKINANTFEAMLKKAGKVVQNTRNEVSKDGKVMTVTSNGTSSSGGRFTSFLLFDKQ